MAARITGFTPFLLSSLALHLLFLISLLALAPGTVSTEGASSRWTPGLHHRDAGKAKQQEEQNHAEEAWRSPRGSWNPRLSRWAVARTQTGGCSGVERAGGILGGCHQGGARGKQNGKLKGVRTFWERPDRPPSPSPSSHLHHGSSDGAGKCLGRRMERKGVVSPPASPVFTLLPVQNGKKRAVQRTKTWRSELKPHLTECGADRAFVHASGRCRAPGSVTRRGGKVCTGGCKVERLLAAWCSQTFWHVHCLILHNQLLFLANTPSPGFFPAAPSWCNRPISGYSLPHADASNHKCYPFFSDWIQAAKLDCVCYFPTFIFSQTGCTYKIKQQPVYKNINKKQVWDTDRRAGNCSHLGRHSVISSNRTEKAESYQGARVNARSDYARIVDEGRCSRREVKGRRGGLYHSNKYVKLSHYLDNGLVFPIVTLLLSTDNEFQKEKPEPASRGQSREVTGGCFSCLGRRNPRGEGYLAGFMGPQGGGTQMSLLNQFSIKAELSNQHFESKKKASDTKLNYVEFNSRTKTETDNYQRVNLSKPSSINAKKVQISAPASDSDFVSPAKFPCSSFSAVSAIAHSATKLKTHKGTREQHVSFPPQIIQTTWQSSSSSAEEVNSTQPTVPLFAQRVFLFSKSNTNSNNNNEKEGNKATHGYNHESEITKSAWHSETQKRDLWENAIHARCAESIPSDCSATEQAERAHMQLKTGNQVLLEPEGVRQSDKQQMGTREERERSTEREGEGSEGSIADADAVWGEKLQVGEGKGEAWLMRGREPRAVKEEEEEEVWEKVVTKGSQEEESEAEVGISQGMGSTTSTITELHHTRGERESQADESHKGSVVDETEVEEEEGQTSRGERSLERLIIVADDGTSPGKKDRRILMPWSRSRRAANRHPHFSLYNYQVQVAENQPPGTSVIIMSASDPDAGDAGRVSYTMAPLMNSRSSDYFHIHPDSGLISTTQILDREHMDLHYFRVTGTDLGSPRLSGTTMVAITVSDRNDHSPIFEQTEYRETIRENVEEGYPILQLRATDSDSPSNANIRYRFVGDSAAIARVAFEIDPRSGLITTRGSVDRETNEHYTLQVEASDQGKDPGPRSATVKVFITVLDENDNVPQFSEKRYVVAVKEDVRPHSEILRVSATDRDKDSNAAVHYNIISGNSRGQFSIDSVTGEIQVVAPLDFESEREYTLRVRAQDNGRPPLSNNTGIVSVQVTDVNDNPPIFVSTPFQASVLESAPVGSSILHIQAIDTDSGDNARLEYRLTGTGSDTPFVINSATGWVTVSSILDRESVEHYFFGVEARDYGMPPLSATASVTITVMDVNDNRPEFLQKEYYARLNEDAAVGTSVVTVTAVDRDVNSAVTYQITGGNTRNRFAISTAGGAGLLSLALPLDYKQERRYVLTVTASDRTLHDTCQVHINITDANTHRPVFQSAHYSVSVNEDKPSGSTVVVISATDDDVGENARITYFLEDNIPQFRIDPATGAITLQAELDYEDQMTYTLAITAKDNGIPQKSDTTYVEVNVNDVNDNAPQFLSPRYQGTVSEDAPPFTSVLQISATDRDAHANGRVQYTFQYGEDGDGDFTIEPTSGIVRTFRRLDRESVPFYELTAYAVDRGVPPQRTPVHIQVTVLDVNDNAPVFPADDFEVLVKENSAVGSVVAQITATDPDEGANAQIMYQIVEGNIPEIFQMDIFSGELTSLIDLDYESRNEYVIVVQATSAPLVSRATVRICLVDQNDNRPTLKDFQIVFNNFVSNRSNSFPSGVIGRVPAHDPDVSDRLHYTIDRGNELHLLLLNHTSGEIKLSRKLDNNRPLVAPMLITVTGKKP